MIDVNQFKEEVQAQEDFVHEKLFEHEQLIDLLMETTSVLLKLTETLLDIKAQGGK